MRRWILFAALLASALTIYFAFTLFFARKIENTFTEPEPLKIAETVNAQSNGNRSIEKPVAEQNADNKKFRCQDRETLEIWKELKKTKLRNRPIAGRAGNGRLQRLYRSYQTD